LAHQAKKDGRVNNFYIEIIDAEDIIKYCTVDATLKQIGDRQVVEGVIKDRSDYYLMKQERDRLLSKMEVLNSGFLRYEVALENNPMAIIFCNLKGEITYANLAFLRMCPAAYLPIFLPAWRLR
jgi:PAS domain-containing protein